VWDLDSGQPLATLTGHESRVRSVAVLSVAVTPDGRRAVSASADDRTLRVWDLDKGICLAVVALDGALTAVAVAPDGETIVAGDMLGNVYCLRYVEANPPLTPPAEKKRGEDR
jgi:WD40 repeat protein